MPDPLKVECPHCNGTLKLKDRSADGKKVRCPKCQEVFKVQLPAIAELDELEDDFGALEDYQDEEPAPKVKAASQKPGKKKRKSGSAKIPWVIVGIVAAVILSLGGLVVVVSQFAGGDGSNKLDLTYLLPDANLVAHLKVQELLTNPLLAGVLSQPAAKQLLNAEGANKGFEFNELVSVTIGSKVDAPTSGMTDLMNPLGERGGPPRPAPANSHLVSVLRTSIAFQVDKLIGDKQKMLPQTHHGKTYHKKIEPAAGFGGRGADSFYFPEPTVMVMAMEADLKLIIDQGTTQARRPEFDIINPNATLLMAVVKDPAINSSGVSQPLPTSVPSQGMELAGKNLELAVSKTIRSGFAGIKFSDQIVFEIITSCADSTGASEMKAALDGVFAELKVQFEKSKVLVTLSGMDEVVPLVEKSLASIKVELTGTQVVMTATIPSEIKAVAESVSKKLAGMAGGSAGMPPPGASAGFDQTGTSGGLPAPGIGINATLTPPGVLPVGTIPPGALPAGSVPPAP